jgi:lipoic acid synthetase
LKTKPQWQSQKQLTLSAEEEQQKIPKPVWLRVKMPSGETYRHLKRMIISKGLHTVCEEALCPNMAECWRRGTATFMILGNVCTRNCRFCAVKTGDGVQHYPRMEEALQVARAVASMKLAHVVVTSVTRDDLEDGGAGLFAETIRQIRSHSKNCTVEVLIPDFRGNTSALEQVTTALPEILGHNLETVPRLYENVRPQARYRGSLEVIKTAKSLNPNILIKSGMMVGLGETWHEVLEVMTHAKATGCDIFTIGQYLRPTKAHLPVCRYYTPEEFETLKSLGYRIGFTWVESGPLVRSSYHADEQVKAVISEQ